MVGASKRRPSAAIVGGACAAREGDLSSLPPLIREKVMKDKRKPAELIRTDLITAMKIPDTEHLEPENFWPIVDPWKTDYDKGVQVPVNPEGTPSIFVKQRKDTTALDAVLGPFFMPERLISVSGEQAASGALFDPARHEWCDATAKTRQLEARPRYNLDQLDFAWLQLLNRQRGACGLLELTEEVLEMVVDDLETRCHNNMTANQLGIEFDEDTQCDVCLSPDSEEGNEMVFCDACDLCVHQACYGIVTVPAGSWLCAPCARGYSAKPPCALCPTADGALKPDADADLWAHVTCALWIPEVTIGTPELMEPLQNLHKIPTWRRRLTCSVCRRDGQGACIQCSFDNCATAYHVTCAQKTGLSLLMCAADVNNPLLELKSFCPAHARYRSAALALHRYKKVIEYGGPSAMAGSPSKRGRSAGNAPVTQESDAIGTGGGQQFLDFVDPNETAAHLRQFVDPLGVDQIFNFWKLKRLERQGRALLPPKHEENSGLQRPVQIDDELSATIRSLVNLRQDLERARNLSYLVQRREKQRKLWIRAREDVTMGQLRAAEEHPESVRIIRTANRLDDIYDRLHSFEKVYGVPADSVVTSLIRTVARDNEKIRGLPISRVASPLTYSAVAPPIQIAARGGGHTVVPAPDRFRSTQSMAAVSPRGGEDRSARKRRREQHSPEGDENNAPLQRARTRLNFATTLVVAPETAASPEKQQCSPTTHRTKRQRPSTPTTPSPSRGTPSTTGTPNSSPSTPRISPTSTSQGTLKFLRVGRRRGGPFKRSMLPDLQSGSPERPLPPTSALRPGRPPSSMGASPPRPVSATPSGESLRQHQPREASPQLEQSPSRRLRETATLPSGGSTAHSQVAVAGQNNCRPVSAAQSIRTASTTAASVAQERGLDGRPHSLSRSTTKAVHRCRHNLQHSKSDRAAPQDLRITRGRKLVADTAVAALKGHFARGTPRLLTAPLSLQLSSSSCKSSTSSPSSITGESSDRSTDQISGTERDDGDDSDSSLEILTGAELSQRTRNSTRSTAIRGEASASRGAAPPPSGAASPDRKPRFGHQPREQEQMRHSSAAGTSNKPRVIAPSNAARETAVRSPGKTSSTVRSSCSSGAGRNCSDNNLVSRSSRINGGAGRGQARPHHQPEVQREVRRALRSREKAPPVDCVSVPTHNGVPENGVSPKKAFVGNGIRVNGLSDVVISHCNATVRLVRADGGKSPVKRVQPQPTTGSFQSDGHTDAGAASRESRRSRNRPAETDAHHDAVSVGGKATPSSSPSKQSPSSPSRTSAEPLVLRSNARKPNGRTEAGSVLAKSGSGPAYGGHGVHSKKSMQYSLCYLDCTVRLQRLSEAQLQRFVSVVPKHETGGPT